jgi:alkanesulfonate monooxygenase SsuD/methylene tetrahydromethanopterin reductase-like flavin-dependent oxidoreductase (luciferase family)
MPQLGVMIEGQEDLTWDRWRQVVSDAERLGFASLRISDHCQSVFGVKGRTSVQAWMALALAAEWSQRIELGPMVSPVTFYHEAILARMAVAVDQLSEGRLILGLGAGWFKAEHQAFGIPFPSWKERFQRLEQAIVRIEDLTTTIPGARRLPLLIGGSGERRTLRLAARHAREWNCLFPSDLEEFRRRSAILDERCREAGRDPRDIRRSMMISYLVGRDRVELLERASRLRDVMPTLADLSPEQVLDTFGQRGVVGTPNEIVDRLMPYAEAGVELFSLQHLLVDDQDQLELLAREVAPAIS